MSDFYNIPSDWDLLKKEFDDLRDEICVFLKTPQKRKSGILPRKKSKDLDKVSKRLKLNVLRTRQDCQSDYS